MIRLRAPPTAALELFTALLSISRDSRITAETRSRRAPENDLLARSFALVSVRAARSSPPGVQHAVSGRDARAIVRPAPSRSAR